MLLPYDLMMPSRMFHSRDIEELAEADDADVHGARTRLPAYGSRRVVPTDAEGETRQPR